MNKSGHTCVSQLNFEVFAGFWHKNFSIVPSYNRTHQYKIEMVYSRRRKSGFDIQILSMQYQQIGAAKIESNIKQSTKQDKV